jgi:hypothetical protein
MARDSTAWPMTTRKKRPRADLPTHADRVRERIKKRTELDKALVVTTKLKPGQKRKLLLRQHIIAERQRHALAEEAEQLHAQDQDMDEIHADQVSTFPCSRFAPLMLTIRTTVVVYLGSLPHHQKNRRLRYVASYYET